MRSIPVFRRTVLDTLLLSCLLAACGGASNEALMALETAEARKSNPRAGRDATSTATPPPPSTSTLPDGSLAWSNPATWGGTLPPAGAEIVIPAGKVITLDTSPPALAGVRIEGTLRFARMDVSLTAGFIDVTGALEIGTQAQPFTHKAIVTLNGAPQSINDGVSRGLNVRGGRLELYGAVPTPVWTKLNDHANAGTTTLTLKESTNWKAGDTIAIAPTDFYGVASTERLPLSSASGAQLGLATPLGKFRWGKMQYVTNAGMSLTPDPSYVPPATPAPTELDERAAVGNLTRNIVIQGADDSAWQTSGFGAHVMVMGLSSKVIVDGVEIRRAGQAGTLARYPFHWHLLSYAADGTMVGDAVGHVLRNSSIWNSSQRCVVLHATNGVQVLNNICQDIKGHAFFLEEAVERRNVFDGNLALMTRSPAAAQLLQVHEGPDVFQGGPSGFWLTNPDNVVRNNHAGDTHGNGFWMAFPRKPLGLSAAVPILPDRTPHGVFEVNTAHTARGPGLLMEWVPSDAAGNVVNNKYIPTVNGAADTYDNRLRLTLKRVTSFKNLDGAYRNRVSAPDYLEWVSADNYGVHIAGAGDSGVVARSLLVGTSLNALTAYPTQWQDQLPSGFATYHSTFTLQDNVLINFPFVAGKASGAFKTDDYYLLGVDKGLARNTGNRLINSNPGFRTLPPNMDGQPLNSRNWTYSGALWDANGYWGSAGNYWVYDVPFLTAGANCVNVAPAGANGKSCNGQYYGVGSFQTDFDSNRYSFNAPIDATRLDSATGAEIGRWSVGDGATSTMLGGMRHFAARAGSHYILRFPGKPPAKWFRMDVNNVFRSDDSFVFAVAFDGTVSATGYTVARHRDQAANLFLPGGSLAQYARWFTDAASLNEVISSKGDKLWQDRANNLLWIKVQGGLLYPDEAKMVPMSDDILYKGYAVLLFSK